MGTTSRSEVTPALPCGFQLGRAHPLFTSSRSQTPKVQTCSNMVTPFFFVPEIPLKHGKISHLAQKNTMVSSTLTYTV